jgi:hypothetical protein
VCVGGGGGKVGMVAMVKMDKKRQEEERHTHTCALRALKDRCSHSTGIVASRRVKDDNQINK